MRDNMLISGFYLSRVNIAMKCACIMDFLIKLTNNSRNLLSLPEVLGKRIPFSYLFRLFSEGILSLLKLFGPQFLSGGIHVVIHVPWISHLLFVHEYLIFAKIQQEGLIVYTPFLIVAIMILDS